MGPQLLMMGIKPQTPRNQPVSPLKHFNLALSTLRCAGLEVEGENRCSKKPHQYYKAHQILMSMRCFSGDLLEASRAAAKSSRGEREGEGRLYS